MAALVPMSFADTRLFVAVTPGTTRPTMAMPMLLPEITLLCAPTPPTTLLLASSMRTPSRELPSL